MTGLIEGLHHVTTLSAGAARHDAFMRETLGLRRVKRTVNRDAPDGYHLFYGDPSGRPGTVLSSVAFPNLPRGVAGVGEVGTTILAVRQGTLPRWRDRLEAADLPILGLSKVGGHNRLWFEGPEGEGYALQTVETDGVEEQGPEAPLAPLGLHGVSIRLADTEALTELMGLIGFEMVEDADGVARHALPGAETAGAVELESIPDGPGMRLGAGSVHHVALAVADRAALDALRDALAEAGHRPSAPIEGPYFTSVFLRAPGDLLIAFATRGPGFDADEPSATMGDALVLPPEHEGERDAIERTLDPLDG